MPVTGRTGLPRSGKSYSALVYDVIPALKSGRQVVTNLPIDKHKLAKLHCTPAEVDLLTILTADELADSFFYTIDRGTGDEDASWPGALIVYDEMQREFGSKDWSKNARRDGLRDWLSHHGHLGCDLVWISQSESLVDVVVLRMTDLVQYTRSHRGMAFARPLAFTTFTYFCVEGIVQTKEPANIVKDRVQMKFAACYKSFQIAGAGANLKPMMPPAAKTAIAGAGVLIAIVLYGIYATWDDLFRDKTESVLPTSKTVVSSLPAPSTPAVVTPSLRPSIPNPLPSREVSYDGHFQDSDGSFLVLCAGDIVGRMEPQADPFVGGTSQNGSVSYSRVGYCDGRDPRSGGGTGFPSLPSAVVPGSN